MDAPTQSAIAHSLSEAAGRCAAGLTTRLVEAFRLLPPGSHGVDPSAIQSALALAFEQGAIWQQQREQQRLLMLSNAENRRAC